VPPKYEEVKSLQLAWGKENGLVVGRMWAIAGSAQVIWTVTGVSWVATGTETET
jgi:hypothetical protein